MGMMQQEENDRFKCHTTHVNETSTCVVKIVETSQRAYIIYLSQFCVLCCSKQGPRTMKCYILLFTLEEGKRKNPL